MNNFIEISLVRDFTDAPGGRYRIQGDYSGEQFREDVLVPALSEHAHVIVDLNGALGLPASFIDEAFGPFAAEVGVGKLEIRLDDNDVAAAILVDCLAKHVA